MKTITTAILLSVSVFANTHKSLAQSQHTHTDSVQHTQNHDTATHKLDQTIVIHNPTVKVTPPGISNSSGYFHIMNHSDKDIELVKAESNIAKRTEIHQHIMKDGLMKMQKINSLIIPAKSAINFEPGSYHIMFINVNKPIVEQQQVKLKLEFSDGSSQTITAIAQDKISTKENKHKHH